MRDKSRRRPQPAKSSPRRVQWANISAPVNNPAMARKLLKLMADTVDDKGVDFIVYWSLNEARRSDERKELAHLRAAYEKSRGKAVRP
jgi:hypothetical protein